MEDELYMHRCLQLARNGIGNTAPNPMVGAVIVCDGKIIGEGYHIRCGEAHAEVNAIRSVRKPELLQRSTIYVSLEPCAHYGKTPPCADLIIEKKIPRIVIGCRDPFSLVAGKGIQKLLDAGREVKVGVLEKECLHLIRKFITFNTHKRPYVTLKWAESADRFLDIHRHNGQPVKLSSELSTMLVHKHRSESTAILVGCRTALLDNPSLNIRFWYGKNPVRVVLDRNLSLPQHLHLFNGAVSTLVFNEHKTTQDQASGIEYVKLDYSRNILPQIMETLYEHKLQSLLVEGGAHTLQSFIQAGIWDEAFVEHTSHLLHDGISAPVIPHGHPYTDISVLGTHIRHYLHQS